MKRSATYLPKAWLAVVGIFGASCASGPAADGDVGRPDAPLLDAPVRDAWGLDARDTGASRDAPAFDLPGDGDVSSFDAPELDTGDAPAAGCRSDADCMVDGNDCTLVPRCEGGTCVHRSAAAGAICRAASGECDEAEACDGTGAPCPPDQLRPAGAGCGAVEPGTCQACSGMSAACPTALVCDDGLACTTNLCAPPGGCSFPVEPGSCAIDGVCRSAGEASPRDRCEACDPLVSQTSWSPLSCGAGRVCRRGACVAHAGIGAGSLRTCAAYANGSVRCAGEEPLGDGTAGYAGPVTVTGVTTATAIDAGDGHACALTSDGGALCWGHAHRGQLGDGTTGDPFSMRRLAPVRVVGLSGATRIATGYSFSCALAGGEGFCWGTDQEGQLGDGGPLAGTLSSLPVRVADLADAVEIAAGDRHACALRGGGTVVCWGANPTGQLGDGTFIGHSSPMAVPGLTDVVALSAGASHTCALRLDGSVWCWGRILVVPLARTCIETPMPAAMPGLSGVVAISSSSFANEWMCALSSDGAVFCLGNDQYGTLGDGGGAGTCTPTRVASIPEALEIAAGATHACALGRDDTVWCWGSNNRGELGNGDVSSVPVRPTRSRL